MARIVCGPNQLEGSQYDGKTIEAVRAELRCTLNIPEAATVLLNETPCSSPGTPLRAEDELEFVKAAGEKG